MRTVSSVGSEGRRFNIFNPEINSSARRWLEGFVPPVVETEPGECEPAFSIMRLPRPFVTPRYVALPDFDEGGFPHLAGYEAILKARTTLMSTRSTLPGLKVKRRFEMLSMNELRIMLALWFNPYVIDAREQYGRFDTETLNRANDNGRRMLRSDLMTIDVICTYVCPESRRLRTHGISVKKADYIPSDEDLAREQRERDSMSQSGWTWELLRGDAVTKTEYGNYGFLWSMVKAHDCSDLYWRAASFANAMLKVSDKGTLGDVLTRAASRRLIPYDEAANLFAVAIAFGFLTLDQRAQLRTYKPLYLIR